MQRPLALSSDDFRALAHSLSDFTADYLERLPLIRSYPENIRGADIDQLFSTDIPVDGIGGAAFDLLPEIFHNSRPASPRFFGYVFGSGEPISALGQFASAVLHQNATAWRSGPSANAIERTVVRWLASAVGCEGFSGTRVHSLVGSHQVQDPQQQTHGHRQSLGIRLSSIPAHIGGREHDRLASARRSSQHACRSEHGLAVHSNAHR